MTPALFDTLGDYVYVGVVCAKVVGVVVLALLACAVIALWKAL